jgi:N-methylhydantoinase A
MYRLSTDVGGTFTDGVLLDEASGRVVVSKVSSTSHNPAIGTIESIEKFSIPLRDVSFLSHGTTVVINALIEGKGAKTALITSRGFRDVLEIGRSNRTEMYDALYRKPRPLVPRFLRLEVSERVGADGQVVVPLCDQDLEDGLKVLIDEEVEAVAVCLLNAYANAEHEILIGEFLRDRLPHATVSLSHLITRRYYEYERTSTATQNAYVMPVVRRYLDSLEEELNKREFAQVLQIMQSNGGVMAASVARDIPIAMVESGPAGGAIGAAELAKLIGYENVISYDMGGTTAKTSIITGGLPETTEQYLVEGRPILLPVVDLREIGAGGGSIAWIDEAGAMHVGPQSAGADPGPACYQRDGAEPTVTDANLQLGILNPDYFLGGEMEISTELAHTVIKRVADHFDLSVDEAALGIVKIVNTNMSGLLQSMTVKRGYDPREFVMVAFGGAGPIHAAAIAKELNVPTVIVPPYSGVFSAWGMLMADLRHDLSQTFIMPLDSAVAATVNGIFRDLEGRVKEVFAKENVGADAITTTYQVDLRYVGQEHTLAVTAPATFSDAAKSKIADDFDEQHLRVYGHNAPDESKEIVSLKVIGLGAVTKPNLERIPEGGEVPQQAAKLGDRDVYVGNGQYRSFDIYRRDRLQAGNVVAGPAIIEEVTATTVVEQGQACEVDPYGNLIISINEEAR